MSIDKEKYPSHLIPRAANNQNSACDVCTVQYYVCGCAEVMKLHTNFKLVLEWNCMQHTSSKIAYFEPVILIQLSFIMGTAPFEL